MMKNRFVTELNEVVKTLQKLNQIAETDAGEIDSTLQAGIEFDFDLPYSSLPVLEGRMWKKTETVC